MAHTVRSRRRLGASLPDETIPHGCAVSAYGDLVPLTALTPHHRHHCTIPHRCTIRHDRTIPHRWTIPHACRIPYGGTILRG
jgi:hypothetical protein